MKLYVPNPQKWVDFFERVSSGKTSLNQSGGGRRLSIIPVDNVNHVEDKAYPIKAVLPAEQTTAQAKSELERRNINPAQVVDMIHSSSGKRRRGTKRKRNNKKPRKGVNGQRGGGKNKDQTRRKLSRTRRKKVPVSRRKDI
ncbi:MAG: hypothetical protein N0C90_04765, partial [Candidatus Thiodiazotropha endolucinida]|nr:hypothetical protein [Candidatus Thiodiazotropha taylori]MCW4260658.1 hypothetical protein [Candidatus Thiodiazotropha endolucinida]